MAGFTSFDDYMNQSTVNGKRKRVDWQKSHPANGGNTPAVAGEWHCYARGAGNPAADALYNVPTALQFQCVSYETQTAAFHGGLPYGGVVGATGADYKQIVAAGAWTAAATVAPCVLMLVDLLGFVRSTTLTGSAVTQTVIDDSAVTTSAADTLTHASIDFANGTPVQISNSGGALPTGISAATTYWTIRQTSSTSKLASTYANAIAGTAISITHPSGSGTNTAQTFLPRYPTGAGVQAFYFANNATAIGAGTPNLSLNYTRYGDAPATGGRTTPLVLPIGKTTPTGGHILYSGTGSGKYGPFVPLQAADQGIVSLESHVRSVTYTSGEHSIALCQPLLQIPITTLGVPGERNLMHQIPSMPRVYDGACLIWLMNSGAATPVASPISGALEFAWS